MPVPTADLLLAFRQAKFALTEERQSVGLDRIAQFERHIESHLGALSQVLEPGGGFSAVPLGEVWVTPKKVTYDVDAHPPDVVSIVESLRPQRLAEIHLRCHLQPTMEFAIAEVLWIWKYGGALDSLLPPECIANRIKRDRVGNVDRWGRRLFHFWKQRYRAFQDAGIAAAKQTLAERGQCAFATFDIRSYYDRIDPSFLLSANLIAKVLPRLPVAARSSYAADTRNLLVKYAEYQTAVEEMMQVPMQGRGIPIGALSSRLVANLALAPLDNRVRRRHGVRHYARWVDDIIVVTDDIEAQDGIAAVAQELLPMQAAGADGALLLNTDLLRRPNSLFEVNRNKARVYWLEGLAGRDFLKVVRTDLDKIVSEQNAFVGGESRTEGTNQLLAMAGARGDDGPEAFQGLDELRVRRFASSVLISKALDSISLLSPGEAPRHPALRSLVRVLAREAEWTSFLDLLLRVVGVAVATPDVVLADESIHLIDRWAREVERFEGLPLWGGHQVHGSALMRLSRFLHARTAEAVARALSLAPGTTIPKSLDPLLAIASHATDYRALLESGKRLRHADLRLLDREVEFARGAPPVDHLARAVLISQMPAGSALAERCADIQRFLDACEQAHDGVYGGSSPIDLFLMVRPPSVFDIGWRWARAYPSDPVPPVRIINALRGTGYGDEMAAWVPATAHGGMLQFPPGASSEPDRPVRIVLANLLTLDSWFEGAAHGRPIATRERMRAFASVVDRARSLRRTGERLLMLFPELSVPRRWMRALAARLGSDHIGVVAGLEYERSADTVANEAVAVLPGEYARLGLVFWRKVTPAVGEEATFLRRQNLRFAPPTHLPGDRVISSPWGAFSVLICSELLEVSARARLPGRIDYVLVPSWNKDRFTFEYLAQAAVLDLHAYVAIANNAHYSDCRIRGPYKEDFRRDVCRLVDRDVDSVISGVPEILALRAFQARPPPPESANPRAAAEFAVAVEQDMFKPVPPGFQYKRP